MVQINTVVIVAVDRYICITRPMSPLKLNQAKAKMCVGIAWGMATTIAFFPFLGWNQYVPEGIGIAVVGFLGWIWTVFWGALLLLKDDWVALPTCGVYF